MQQDKVTLLLGGHGKTGRRVAERLTKTGVAIRIGSRSSDPPFDWEKRNTWPPALQGVQSAYVTYYPDLAFPGAVENVRTFAKLAVDSGVRRLVLLSGRGEESALLGEQAIQESGADWTIVRASWFNQNFSEGHLLEAVLSGVVAFPARNIAEPFVDAEDIADVVTAALVEKRHIGQVYEVTGPRLLTFTEAVAEIAKATGRQIQYAPISAEQYGSALVECGLPADFVTPLVKLFTTVLDGRNARLTQGVQRALGRAPRDFADYALDAAAKGVWTASRAKLCMAG